VVAVFPAVMSVSVSVLTEWRLRIGLSLAECSLLHCPYPVLSVYLSLLLARGAFRRLGHLWLISKLKLLLHIVESIVGWMCYNNGGALVVWIMSGSLLRVSHLLAPSLLLALSLFFFPRMCRRRFRPNIGFVAGFRP
jgi:hypothetical protein